MRTTAQPRLTEIFPGASFPIKFDGVFVPFDPWNITESNSLSPSDADVEMKKGETFTVTSIGIGKSNISSEEYYSIKLSYINDTIFHIGHEALSELVGEQMPKIRTIKADKLMDVDSLSVDDVIILTSGFLGEDSDDKFIEEHREPLIKCGLYEHLIPVKIVYNNISGICFETKLTDKGVEYFMSEKLASHRKECMKLMTNNK